MNRWAKYGSSGERITRALGPRWPRLARGVTFSGVGIVPVFIVSTYIKRKGLRGPVVRNGGAVRRPGNATTDPISGD